jgi:eukaryotic-like serine/threonine-protein kinase
MRDGIIWCPHCAQPHKLGEKYCRATGKLIDQRIHEGKRFSSSRPHPLIGMVIDDKFEILRRIGSGGMGEVFEAENRMLQRSVAIKIVAGSNPDAADRLRREARVIASIQHPNICDVYDIGVMPNGSPYLVLERLTGETLQQCFRREGRLSTSRTIEMFTQILSGVQHAHASGIVHRDLKPANVFLVERIGCIPLVKVLDFGLAKDLSGNARTLTRPGRACGTPHYMSPEQLCGRAVDGRSDLFSIGIMLFEALLNHHPFAAPTIVEMSMKIAYEPCSALDRLRRKVPKDLADLVERALHKDPERRPQSAIEMQTALATLDLPDDEEESLSDSQSLPWIAISDSSISSGDF